MKSLVYSSRIVHRKTSGGVLSLSSLKAGQYGVIASLDLEDPQQLERFKSLGLVSGGRLFMERDFPVLSVRLEFSHIFMDRELAAKIFVIPIRQQ